jgi:hypothetical protein
MTDDALPDLMAGADLGPLPDMIEVTQSFIARLPSQRIIDLLKRLEPDMKFGELMEDQPPRMIAFRALLRDHPRRDPASLWLHAYDVEVAIAPADPFSPNGQTASPASAPTIT